MQIIGSFVSLNPWTLEWKVWRSLIEAEAMVAEASANLQPAASKSLLFPLKGQADRMACKLPLQIFRGATSIHKGPSHGVKPIEILNPFWRGTAFFLWISGPHGDPAIP